ncbi:MAG: DNA polymerase III subunit gamma/tau [Bryobacteraceae bacterium]
MYQVIARKYRPQTFSDVVSQEHVKSTLENAIAQNRIAHGYIFSGQRGTGKTTVARILARCLNCVSGPTNKPCGECSSCVEIAAGSSVDVIEIDAASNRGINEMRELRENVRYQPARDRYKVFIIDEAHQITNEAFNALLKTIEEPPPWAVFVLCTTETHKIPATIASRCQQFSFRSVDFDEVTSRIRWICSQEGIDSDEDTIAVLAQAGEGSVRDSLSALDQAIACCGSKLEAAQVRSLLGGFSLQTLYQVTTALSESSPSRMLAIVDELERNGHNLQHFSRELARYFRNLLVAKVAEPRLIPASVEERQRLAGIAAGFSEEDLTRYLQLALDLFKDLQASLQPRFHLELGLVRMVQAGKLLAIEEALASLEVAAPGPKSNPSPVRTAGPAAPSPPAPTRPTPFEVDRAKKASRGEPQLSDGANALAPAPLPPAAGAVPSTGLEWKQGLHACLIELGMVFTADGVEHSSLRASASELHFATPKEFLFAMKEDHINKAVRKILGRSLKITITATEASTAGASPAPAQSARTPNDDLTRRALENPEVQRFQQTFGGQVRTVRNLKE